MRGPFPLDNGNEGSEEERESDMLHLFHENVKSLNQLT